MGVNFFKGLYFYCSTSHLSSLNEYQQILNSIDTKNDCLNIGGEWVIYDRNYNDIMYGLITSFESSQGFDWSDVMYAGLAARSDTLVPRRYSN